VSLCLCGEDGIFFGFFNDLNIADDHRLIDRFAHIKESQGGDADGGEGLHFNSGFAGGFRHRPDFDRFCLHLKLKIDFMKRQRMTKGD